MRLAKETIFCNWNNVLITEIAFKALSQLH